MNAIEQLFTDLGHLDGAAAIITRTVNACADVVAQEAANDTRIQRRTALADMAHRLQLAAQRPCRSGRVITEGWNWLYNSTRQHYFRDGRAICGKWALIGGGGASLRPTPEYDMPECKLCQAKREKETHAETSCII